MAFHTLHGLSLCAGVGGLELGLHIAEPRYRTVCFVEREAYAAATLVARMADQALDPAPVWDNLKTFKGRPWRGRVHILSAGYPCQPFSIAGKRGGEKDPRHLWPHVARIVRETAPPVVFLENVKGHLDIGFRAVARELRSMGYGLEADLFPAAEVGASHERERLFVLAYTDDVRQWKLSGRDLPPGQADPVSLLSSGPPNGGADRGRADLVCDVGHPDSVWRGEEGASRPIFAPAPSDLEGWAKLLHTDAGLKPALPGADDGMAGRVDRRIVAGNGVCSLAAAYAWRTLTARIDALRDR